MFLTLTLTVYRKGCTLKLNIAILRGVFDIDPHRLPEGLHAEFENERPYNDFETSKSRSTVKKYLKCTKMNPSPDPPDPADLVHGPRQGTPGPHAPGVRMTAVLNKLPQISKGLALARDQEQSLLLFASVFNADGILSMQFA